MHAQKQPKRRSRPSQQATSEQKDRQMAAGYKARRQEAEVKRQEARVERQEARVERQEAGVERQGT